ncbi:3',5'-cyclic adenosine monophosphate phosphodiesterase CpdA [compost metagenome]
MTTSTPVNTKSGMTNKIRWIHVSDFHFGKSSFDQEFTSKQFISHIREKSESQGAPNFIFITGDVANAGKEEEYELFANYIFYPLLEIFGDDFAENILVVPGNHDLNQKHNSGFSKQKFLKMETTSFHPTIEGAAGRKMVAERFEIFCKHAAISNAGSFLDENGAFSIECEIEKKKVGIVGINTAWLCDGDGDYEALTPGIQILRAALEKIPHSDLKFVLGHHPLEWIHQSHRSAIKSIFAANHVIYLHGHMHAENFSNQLNGSGDFVSIQAGAAWQAPEGGKWKNGFMWGEIDSEFSTISLRPYSWSLDNQCWTLDGTRFHENYQKDGRWDFSAPQKKSQPDFTPKKKLSPLVGWEVKDFDSLQQLKTQLDSSEAISYFDGAIPTWATAISQSIPRREIVGKISRAYQASSDFPIVCILLAAACEGKTTAVLQAAHEIIKVNRSKKILFRTNHTRKFEVTELLDVLQTNEDWLIVIDEADQIAADVAKFIQSGLPGFKGKIDFLLTSRDSDWKSSRSNEISWDFRAKFKELVLKDLSSTDADAIVESWAEFGKDGLGEDLVALPADKRSEKLRFYAKKEAKGGSESFFGALLMCRHGNDLLDHAEAMLNKLAQVQLQCGKSLKDVLGYIAAMHAEGFNKLTFAALATITEMSVAKLQSEVIRQLGKEAAATSTSSFVYTRHKSIAVALLEVLENKFDEDISHYYLDLALSEVARSKNDFVDDLSFWRFDLAENLFISGKTRLGIEIAEKLYEAEDSDFYLLTHLASLYRLNGNAARAIELFRSFTTPPQSRGFYFEWGMCEGRLRNYLENALLAIHALSDESQHASLTVIDARMYLTGISKCWGFLYTAYANKNFLKAQDACDSMLLILAQRQKLADTEVDLNNFIKEVSKKTRSKYGRIESIKILKDSSLKLYEYTISKAISDKVDIRLASFTSLETIIKNIESP